MLLAIVALPSLPLLNQTVWSLLLRIMVETKPSLQAPAGAEVTPPLKIILWKTENIAGCNAE